MVGCSEHVPTFVSSEGYSVVVFNNSLPLRDNIASKMPDISSIKATSVKATGGNTPLSSTGVTSSSSSEAGELAKRMMKGATRKV